MSEEEEDEIDQLYREGYILRCKVLYAKENPSDHSTSITALAASNKVIVKHTFF
jgi:regulator of replication initiation timing